MKERERGKREGEREEFVFTLQPDDSLANETATMWALPEARQVCALPETPGAPGEAPDNLLESKRP